MKIWLGNKWDEVQSSFWFVPGAMVAGAVLLSLGTLRVDRATAGADHFAELGWTFTRGPEGSRAVLAAVAGSMMTIASVTFSITIVALQLASSQFGPRLLRNFMRDRGNQVAMGTFIATFTYSLLILRTVNGTEGERFVPQVSVSVGLGLALLSLGVLIYFIHHAAESIQAENVIAAAARELHRAIGRLYPATLGRGPRESRAAGGAWDVPADFEARSRPIPAPSSNYLQAIDEGRLLALARERDLIVAVVRRPGKFAFAGDDLARAWPAERVDDDLARRLGRAFFLGRRRTTRQDAEFALEQLVEVAVRAASSGGVPFTAMACLDRIAAGLGDLAAREIPSRYRYDDAGRLRVVTDASTADGFVDAAFHMIRQAARGNEAVTLHLLESIAAVARRTDDPAFRAALLRHAELVHRGAVEGLEDAADRRDADDRFEAARRALAPDLR